MSFKNFLLVQCY